MTRNLWIWIIVVAGVAVGLRLPRLQLRPMHGDEAVHAVKFADLLEGIPYRYDPNEFHGPTLNYFTIIAAKVAGEKSYADLTEETLRIVPVFFGIALVILPLLLADVTGRPAAIVAAFLMAISNAFVFYSRYYIQEMLLVCFTGYALLCGWRYMSSGKAAWAVTAGGLLGLMHATKETCIIAYGAMAAAAVMAALSRRVSRESDAPIISVRPSHIAAAAIACAVSSALFYSSFLRNPAGIIDSLRTYAIYVTRAGQNNLHAHPWYYYLKVMLYSPAGVEAGWKAPWTEALIVLGAAAGAVFSFKSGLLGRGRVFLQFLVFYALTITVAYSAIRYKTPWCVLNLMMPMILLAGVGLVGIIERIRRTAARVVVALFLVLAGVDLALQAFVASYISYADHNCPYVYAHPTDDVVAIASKVERVSQAHPDRRNMPIQVVCPGDDYWPLPWYLRKFTKVGYWSEVSGALAPAPVVIASPDVEDKLIAQLYNAAAAGRKNLYVPLFERTMLLRPDIELRGYVTMELLDQFNRLVAHKESQSGNTVAGGRGGNSQVDEMTESNYAEHEWAGIADLHHFTHGAMNTVFEVYIVYSERQYAEQAAWAAFSEANRIEEQLSRFIPNSDISRFCSAAAGEPVRMGLDAFECLQRSVQLSRDTAGAFDITAGAMIDCWLNKDKTIRSPTSDEIADAMRRTGSNLIELDQDEHTATPLVDGLRIDLGGIGKGYAAEKMTAIFDEWGIETAFIYAGKSSARAIGSPPGMAGWPVTLRDPRNRDDVLARIHLRDISMGASGVEKGRHIIDTRQGRPVEGRLAAWSLAADATAADSLSTAFMVMTPQEVDDYCTRHSEAAALIIIDKTGADGTDTLKYGRWPR